MKPLARGQALLPMESLPTPIKAFAKPPAASGAHGVGLWNGQVAKLSRMQIKLRWPNQASNFCPLL